MFFLQNNPQWGKLLGGSDRFPTMRIQSPTPGFARRSNPKCPWSIPKCSSLRLDKLAYFFFQTAVKVTATNNSDSAFVLSFLL